MASEISKARKIINDFTTLIGENNSTKTQSAHYLLAQSLAEEHVQTNPILQKSQPKHISSIEVVRKNSVTFIGIGNDGSEIVKSIKSKKLL